jgi:hypothetical protein
VPHPSTHSVATASTSQCRATVTVTHTETTTVGSSVDVVLGGTATEGSDYTFALASGSAGSFGRCYLWRLARDPIYHLGGCLSALQHLPFKLEHVRQKRPVAIVRAARSARTGHAA